MSDELRHEFIVRIEDLRAQISNRHNALNLEAIWLFVATLGCWSVYQPWVQLVALLLVLAFFSFKVSKDEKYSAAFSKLLKNIREDIEASELEGDIKKARLYDLNEIDSNLLSLKTIYKSTPMFLVGYVFWAFCLLYFGYNLFFSQ